MSATQDGENGATKVKRKEGDDIEISAANSTTAKSVESTTAIETSEKSDTQHDTSGASVVQKKPAKKKKKKVKTSPSTSPSPQKKMKKDPNKPEYPKVGEYFVIKSTKN